MKIVATKVRGRQLKPGDLFSTAGQEYWDNIHDGSIGQKVYIRTDEPCPENAKDEEIYVLEVVK